MPNETAVDGVGHVALVTDGVQVDWFKSSPHLCNYFGISQQVRKIIGQYTDKPGHLVTNASSVIIVLSMWLFSSGPTVGGLG